MMLCMNIYKAVLVCIFYFKELSMYFLYAYFLNINTSVISQSYLLIPIQISSNNLNVII